jgi:hypothetical protein
MKLITIFGQTFYLLITFSLLFVHNEYWDLPLIIVLLMNLQNLTLIYFYPIVPILALSMLLFTLVSYGKKTSSIWKHIINLSAYFLLLGSIFLMATIDGSSNENLFTGFLPSVTLLLFILTSICFLSSNISGLIKITSEKI